MTKDLERLKKWKKEHRAELRIQNRRNAQRLHARVTDFLGGKCAHCGITDKRLLQVNHLLKGRAAKDLRQPREQETQVRRV